MALAQYSDLFWYPSGALAAGVAVRIFPHDSNILAPLFTDATGTVPLANPLTTSPTGTIVFWAEAGLYWMHADSESFEIGVGLTPDDPDAIENLQAAVLQLQGDMTAVEGDVTTLESSMVTVQGDVTALEGDVSALQTDVATVQGDVTVLEGAMTTAQGDITALESAVTTLQGDMAAVEGDVASLQGDVAALQAGLSDVEAMAATSVSTGISAGGDISVNGLNPAAIDIAPFEGYFTDFSTDPFNPVITRIEYPGTTVAMDAAALLRTATAWLMDSDLNIIQQATPPTNEQRRTHIFIGVTAQVGGIIIVDQSLPVILQQPADQFTDLLTSLGAFSISGNRVTPNGANLMINQSSGQLFSQAFNHFAGAVQTNDPHVSTTIAQTPASFRYVTSTSSTFGLITNLIDVANFDVGGVVTAIGGGAGSSTIHRVYLFPNNTATEQIAIQYGMTTYSSLAAAADRIGAGVSFTPNPLMRAAALIGYIAVTRTATNLSDPAQAVFVAAGKFATP